MKPLSLMSIICSMSILTGCASVTGGTSQSVSVQTPKVSNAQCALSNDKGKWYVNSTPGSVVVHRSYQDLIVTCQKPGYQEAMMKVKSTTRGATAGNILLGGIIGAGVDMIDGAAYHYPIDIQVAMVKTDSGKHV